MVRLVFRPYTQVRRSICTLESLRTSTRVSPGFVLLKHSSPSFGSNQICSYSRISQKINGGWCCWVAPWHLILTFISLMGFSPANSHVWLTPWSVFQDGSKKAVSAESHKPLRPTSVKKHNLRRTWKKVLYSTVVNLILPSVGRGSSSATTSGPFEETFRLCFRKASPTSASFLSFLLNDFKSFNPLFKVLFIFPSQYLFAIGFPSIFSLRWSISPN